MQEIGKLISGWIMAFISVAEIQYEIEIHEDHRARRSAMDEDAVYEQVEQHQLQFLIFICLPIVSSWSVNVAEPEIQL